MIIGLIKARGCHVDFSGKNYMTLATDISAVRTAPSLDFSYCNLGGNIPDVLCSCSAFPWWS